MSHPTVLLAPRVTKDSVRVWETANALGWPTRRLGSWRVPEGLAEASTDFVIYAEPLFAEAVSDQLGLILLEPPPDWLCRLPPVFCKRRITLVPLSEARTLTVPTFIKPAEGKVFEARVYQTGSELPTDDTVDGTLLVLCSEPFNFQFEVRTFLRGREFLSLSPYWRNGALAQNEAGDWPFLDTEEAEARAFLETILASPEVELPPACVLDIGRTSGGEWAIIEANPCWGAGLYGCHAPAALEAGRHALKHTAAMTEENWRWTSPRFRNRQL